jgi:uncharacterized protein YndB with AHSA1/START domain
MTGNPPDRRRILGSLRSADGKGIVRMEDRFDTDIDDLWAALTDPRRLARWYGEVGGDLRLGGEFHLRLPSAGDRTGRVDACERPRRLALTMRDPDPQPGQPDETVLEATLTADGSRTTLVVEVRGMPHDLLAAYGTGIQVQIEDLGAHVAGRERSNDEEARWKALLPAYQDLAASLSA